MGDELWELVAKEDSSDSVDEEQEASPEGSYKETPKVPHRVTNPIPLFGIPLKAPTLSFGTFDDASVRDSLSFAMPR